MSKARVCFTPQVGLLFWIAGVFPSPSYYKSVWNELVGAHTFWVRFPGVGWLRGLVFLHLRQPEPSPASSSLSVPAWASGPFLSQFLFSASWHSQSLSQFIFPPALDGNPGYFERSFASWENLDVALIARKVTHPVPPIQASHEGCSKYNDNINDHKRINSSLVNANFVCVFCTYMYSNPHNIPERWRHCHFMDKETKAQRRYRICPSQGWAGRGCFDFGFGGGFGLTPQGTCHWDSAQQVPEGCLLKAVSLQGQILS